MLVLAMAIVALIGILILARADRSKFPNRTVPEPTAEGSEAGIDRTAALPSSKGTGEKPVVTSPQPAGDHQPPAETHQEAKELEREERVAAHIVDASCDHPTDGKSGIWSLTTPRTSTVRRGR